MDASELMVDGNALAGMLSELFVPEPTLAECTCDGCGTTAPLAEARVYERGPGAVLRCGSCSAVMLVVVEARGRYVLGFEALRCLAFAAPGGQTAEAGAA